MRILKWLVVAGLIGGTTAACTEQYGYPSTAYNSGYYNSGYYGNNAYYTPSRTGYVYTAPSAYSTSRYAYSSNRYGARGDYDRDGIPNKYDRDANGDHVPDRYQR
jgi:hypothetical protein